MTVAPSDRSHANGKPSPTVGSPPNTHRDEFLADVLTGLSSDPKTLPCKYFYNAEGSRLFDLICDLPEYYPTRCELQLMRDEGEYIAAFMLGSAMQIECRRDSSSRPVRRRLIELGSGSSTKTRILIDNLPSPLQYVPIDISFDHLEATADHLRREYPDLDIHPLARDFTSTTPFDSNELDEVLSPVDHTIVYFPGSTIGNFDSDDATALLRRVQDAVGPRGDLIIGFDLDKSGEVLEAAYDDAQGITARFNLNLLKRINDELSGTFDLDSFDHQAQYNAKLRRVEMHLVSRRAQTVRVGNHAFEFSAGETIHTENSHKYQVDQFEALLRNAGWVPRQFWTDQSSQFGVMLASTSDLWRRFCDVRQASETIAEPLDAEDQMIQSMPDASPVRWHLAHTTWFFETFLLQPQDWYQSPDPRFEALFNSYYNGVGKPFPRHRRGIISRPSVADVTAYRKHVDAAMGKLLLNGDVTDRMRDTIEIGLHHEQQHQELMLTDLKHALSCNPLDPIYQTSWKTAGGQQRDSKSSQWISFDEALTEIGFDRGSFSFDNESPRHRVWLDSYSLQDRLVTNEQWMQFIDDDGYQTPSLWLSMGWDWVREQEIAAPMYWRRHDDQWKHFTLTGVQSIDPHAPVRHVSYFEADAFARWSRAVLPTESQWEHAAASDQAHRFHDLTGEVWQWTCSQYSAYPGYQPPTGTLGEYNGKFMCNQFVLRGGSIATPKGHTRTTYRNFFGPSARWQFTGVRLARFESIDS
ncbi:MAG: ergothioneine biosynthesis protein EgtB [Planctomycetota bacterium]